MQRTFICKGCGQEKTADPRQKGHQKFCGEPACQRARKRQWHRMKMETDTTYRAQQYDCLQRWRQERPLDRYQHQYRQTHPEYVAENRHKQHVRNRKRRSEARSEVIVKMDALSQIESDTYIMRPLTSEKIVKMDSIDFNRIFLRHCTQYGSCRIVLMGKLTCRGAVMFEKSVIVPERRRQLAPPFAWVDRRFLFDGFLERSSQNENLLYFFLVLAADRDGLSFYSYDRICQLLKLTVDDYIESRDGLIEKQLIAFDGRQFQVLSLPRREIIKISNPPELSGTEKDAQNLSEILACLAQRKAEPSDRR